MPTLGSEIRYIYNTQLQMALSLPRHSLLPPQPPNQENWRGRHQPCGRGRQKAAENGPFQEVESIVTALRLQCSREPSGPQRAHGGCCMHQSSLANSTIRQVKQRRTVPGCSESAGRRAGVGREQGSMWPLAALDERVHVAPSCPLALALLSHCSVKWANALLHWLELMGLGWLPGPEGHLATMWWHLAPCLEFRIQRSWLSPQGSCQKAGVPQADGESPALLHMLRGHRSEKPAQREVGAQRAAGAGADKPERSGEGAAQPRLMKPRMVTCSLAGPQLQTLRCATPAELHHSTRPTSVPPTPSSQVADALASESVVP
ncbi:unnamed protein product [Rangifer tarandus platyrhynchus]|uniref:Uncharacterized protein n=1 Tax=Rangifer tarandus platyrhynchus TaxID=3082113 RepID=A0AC59Z2P3_RANTA